MTYLIVVSLFSSICVTDNSCTFWLSYSTRTISPYHTLAFAITLSGIISFALLKISFALLKIHSW